MGGGCNQVGCSANISFHVLRSTSSGGFGLGLGNGLLLGYSTWRFSSGGYGGFGYGHNYGQYARVGGYSTERWDSDTLFAKFFNTIEDFAQ